MSQPQSDLTNSQLAGMVARLNRKIKKAKANNNAEEVLELINQGDILITKISKNRHNIEVNSCKGCSEGAMKLQKQRLLVVDKMIQERGGDTPREFTDEIKRQDD